MRKPSSGMNIAQPFSGISNAEALQCHEYYANPPEAWVLRKPSRGISMVHKLYKGMVILQLL